MTDPGTADRTYVAPMTPELVEQVIEKERPDAILPTMGGQTALNLAVSLAERGTFEKYNVELIGAKLDAINKAEDRELFKQAMEKLGVKNPPSGTATTLQVWCRQPISFCLCCTWRKSISLSSLAAVNFWERFPHFLLRLA